MEGVVGLIGILVFLAGVHLLWQAREDVLFWMRKFLAIFRRALRESSSMPEPGNAALGQDAPPLRPGAGGSNVLRMVGGLGLVVLGQILFLLGLVMVIVD